MNEIIIIIGLFIDVIGAILVISPELISDKLKIKNPKIIDSIEKISVTPKYIGRKRGFIAILIGFIVQVFGHVLRPF